MTITPKTLSEINAEFHVLDQEKNQVVKSSDEREKLVGDLKNKKKREIIAKIVGAALAAVVLSVIVISVSVSLAVPLVGIVSIFVITIIAAIAIKMILDDGRRKIGEIEPDLVQRQTLLQQTLKQKESTLISQFNERQAALAKRRLEVAKKINRENPVSDSFELGPPRKRAKRTRKK